MDAALLRYTIMTCVADPYLDHESRQAPSNCHWFKPAARYTVSAPVSAAVGAAARLCRAQR